MAKINQRINMAGASLREARTRVSHYVRDADLMFGGLSGAFGELFDRNERNEMNAIRNTLSGAIGSGDEHQLHQAKEFMEIINNLSSSGRKTINENNTLNHLANASIGDMVKLLRELLDATKDNGKMEFNIER